PRQSDTIKPPPISPGSERSTGSTNTSAAEHLLRWLWTFDFRAISITVYHEERRLRRRILRVLRGFVMHRSVAFLELEPRTEPENAAAEPLLHRSPCLSVLHVDVALQHRVGAKRVEDIRADRHTNLGNGKRLRD